LKALFIKKIIGKLLSVDIKKPLRKKMLYLLISYVMIAYEIIEKLFGGKKLDENEQINLKVNAILTAI
ncbi:hypothetical protein ACFL4A_03290, partial [bacterium]